MTHPSLAQAACKEGEVAVGHYFTAADIEKFPAKGSNEIDFPSFQRLLREGGVVFTIEVDRCTGRPYGLVKYVGGKAVYGYYYRYSESGQLKSLDFRFIDGIPTVMEIMSRI